MAFAGSPKKQTTNKISFLSFFALKAALKIRYFFAISTLLMQILNPIWISSIFSFVYLKFAPNCVHAACCMHMHPADVPDAIEKARPANHLQPQQEWSVASYQKRSATWAAGASFWAGVNKSAICWWLFSWTASLEEQEEDNNLHLVLRNTPLAPITSGDCRS